MSIQGQLPTNWYEAYGLVTKAMHIDADFCLDVLTAVSDEAASLVLKARRIVNGEFNRQNAARRSRRLEKATKRASVIVRTRIAPRPSGYVLNPLLD